MKTKAEEKKRSTKLVVAHCGPWGEPANVATTGPAVAGFVGDQKFDIEVVDGPDQLEGEIPHLIRMLMNEANDTLADAERLKAELDTVLSPGEDKTGPCEDPAKGPQTEVGGRLLAVFNLVKNIRETINDIRERMAV
jgi:hypothetical protein